MVKHIHMYRRIRGRPDYYQCGHPRCSHYTHKSYLFGKLAICNRCGLEFRLNTENLRQSKPHCDDCIVRKSKQLPKSIIVQDRLIDILTEEIK